MIRKSVIMSIIAVIILGMTAGIYAQVPILIPNFINYQGQLVRNTPRGPMPVTSTYTMTFRIYNNPNDIIEDSLWTETQDVEVKQGIYNVMLGEVTALDLLFDQDYWLGLQIAPDPEMTPRHRIVSIGYSYMAEDSYFLNGHKSGPGGLMLKSLMILP